MDIKLVLTGGTIDKSYQESDGELAFDQTHIVELLELGRNLASIDVQPLMLKDSLEMDDADRQQVSDACLASTQSNILITHGTDTMVETAAFLAKSQLDKTIVLVGAMIPFVFKHSDASFNIGFALAAVQVLPVGVYIAMNGKVFEWDKVTKNLALGQFEEK